MDLKKVEKNFSVGIRIGFKGVIIASIIHIIVMYIRSTILLIQTI